MKEARLSRKENLLLLQLPAPASCCILLSPPADGRRLFTTATLHDGADALH